MDLLSLLEVASMPNLQVLLICLLGAFLATDYCTLFPVHARTSLNKIVFTVFTPCLMFSNLVKTVTFEDIVSWWFMPINIGLNFLIGGILGWIHGNPFSDHDTCTSLGLSYASFSNAVGGFYLWTSTYHLVKTSSLRLKALEQFKALDHGSNGDLQTHLLSDQNGEQAHLRPASMVGFIFGAVAWLRHLVVGDNAPFRAIQAAAILLGNGAIPCTTLILGGNLIQGLRSSKVKATTILGVIAVRYFALPAIGVLVVKAADKLGFLAADPLYQFLLMIQYATPPAMSISTMTQLFGVGQEECSVLLMCLVGAFLATDYSNLLPAQARASLNKIVFAVFTPCLMFANLAQTVTFQDIVSWWFMPVNIALTFLFGWVLGWIVIKLLKPNPYLEGLWVLPMDLYLPSCEDLLLAIESLGGAIESQEVEGSLEKRESSTSSIWAKTLDFLRRIVQESMTPPSLGALVGFIFGAVWWLRNLVVGDNAPFRVLQDSVQLLGNGTIPCTTLIMGGNLTQGLRSSKVKPKTIVGVIAVRYFALPAIGVLVVKAADTLGCLAADPLYHFMLMVQYTTPPAMSISTMTQLFGVGQEECSVIMLWTYLVAALSLALWGAIFMWILS
ncbi:Protein PIN-LIKES 5 [Cucurbita argyrosperma subsp. argyrosperma]|nr:Protein PIN-LIKES 5 [Cucurbita argyrosperma subsp. argyrosperma]